MNVPKLGSLRIDTFRGIRHLDLQVNGKNLIIVGENGSGKSSIVDAIEYAFTRQISKLRGRADVSEAKSIPYLGYKQASVRITFHERFHEPIRINFPRPEPDVPTELQPFFTAATERPFILRRAQILEFINARPSERYEKISQLIGLEQLDQIDRQWKKQMSIAEKQVRHLENEREADLARLSEILESDITNARVMLQVINSRLARIHLPPISNRIELNQRQLELGQVITAETEAGKDGRRQKGLEILAEIQEGISELERRYTQLQQASRVYEQAGTALEDASFESLLSEGLRRFEERPELQYCPLCESGIEDTAVFLVRLRQRLSTLTELTATRMQVREARQQIGEQLDYLLRSITAMLDNLPQGDIPAVSEMMRPLEIALQVWRKKIGEGQEQPIDDFGKWNRVLTQVEDKIQEQGQLLETDGVTQERIDLLDLLPRVDEIWRNLQQVEPRLRQARYLMEQIRLIYDELLAARRRGLQALNQSLEDDFKYLYQQLHPDEGYEAIKMPVQLDKRSSVDLNASFYDQDGSHPLNYFSEGHLDSLGLCIFLAFIKRFNGGWKVIALDDVLSTVDAGHRLRVARLLSQEFADYQLVLTTHDKLWAEQLRLALSDATMISLKQWSRESGTECWDILTDWDYYREQARIGRVQDAIGGTGRNLEKFLCEMRHNLHLAVPARRGDAYTIGDLYDPFFKWLSAHPPSRPDRPAFIKELDILKTELDEVWRLRNWAGAHFNEWAAVVSANEALSFIEAVQQLVESFQCPVCCNLVVYHSGVGVLQCPRCKPKPVAIVYEYRPDWHQRATRLMQFNKPAQRHNAIPLTQMAWRSFLRDMRHKLQLKVVATFDDQYEVVHLHEPFFTWLLEHPRIVDDNWPAWVKAKQQALALFWTGTAWRDIRLEEANSFVETVYQLVRAFECERCSQLVSYSYDDDTRGYFCEGCDRGSTAAKPAGALWFVKK